MVDPLSAAGADRDPEVPGDGAPAAAPVAAPREGLVGLSVRRPIALVMIAVAVAVFGLVSLRRLPVDLMPGVDRPTVTVRTEVPGAAPGDVEERVSRRLEEALSVVGGLRRITSVSRAETCDVILEFSWESDLRQAVQDIREKLDQAFLPDDAEKPTVLRYDPRLEPILLIGLEGPSDLATLRRIAEEEVERRLETVDGIAAVRVRGGLEEEIAILVDEERLRSRGVSIERIAVRLAEENLDQAAGRLSDGETRYIVRTRNELRSLAEIAAIPIRVDGDAVVRLSDVATVVTGPKEERVITRIDGRPAVQVEILREGDANIVELAARVRERLFGTPESQEQLRRWRSEQEAALLLPDAGAESSSGARTDAPSAAAPKAAAPAVRRTPRPDYIASWLPPDTRLVLLSDQSVFIEGAIDDLRNTVIVGGVLAIVVLYLFLGRIAYTAVVALSIPCSVVATFAPMLLGGVSLNIMSLGGLALGVGMLVDSGIVVLEAIFRRREDGFPAVEAAITGAREVAQAVIASTLTTLAVFLPIVFVEGMAGRFFRDQALTVVFSLAASLVVSLTLVPMLAARLGELEERGGGGVRARLAIRPRIGGRVRSLLARARGRTRRRVLLVLLLPAVLAYLAVAALVDLAAIAGALLRSGILLLVGPLAGALRRGGDRVLAPILAGFGASYAALERAYVRAISISLDRRGAVLLVTTAAVGVALLAARDLGSEFVPEASRGEFTLHVRYPVGTPIEMTDRYARGVERALVGRPGVATVATIVGRDPEEIGEANEGEHTARFPVRIDRGHEETAVVEERLIGAAGAVLDAVGDLDWEVRRPSIFSTQSPIEIEMRGPDLELLGRLERQVREILATIPALREVHSTIAPGSPEVHLTPDRDALARHGLTSERIADALRRKNLGVVASRFREGDRRIDIRVQSRPEDRESVEDLLALVVSPREGGDGLRLGDLLESWESREGPAEIRRIGRQRAVVVSAEVEGIDLGSVARTIETRLLGELRLPADVHLEVVGQRREMEESLDSLLGALALAIFLVYVVMASEFESLLQPLVILLTIPLASVGVIGTLWATDTPLSVMAFIGMIVLAGIVVNNAIVLLDLVNRLLAEGRPMREALVEGGRQRLRPILMTAGTTVLGLLPVTGALSSLPLPEALERILGSGDGVEIRAPLALTVIGGLVSSTLLTLIVVPVIASFVGRDRLRRGGAAVGEPRR